MLKDFFKKNMKIILKQFIRIKIFRILYELASEVLWDDKLNIKHNGIDLNFIAPNQVNRWRVRTFSTEEPETLNWIDKFENDSVFWDIGANIGLYSCYAAKKSNCKVYAFEPSIFNLHLLGKNIWLNNLVSKITIFSLPLTHKINEDTFNMSSMEPGGANSTFSENYDYKGDKNKEIFNFSTLGVPADKIVDFFNIPKPTYVKLDVDGIEHLIIKGGLNSLKSAKSILVEIDEKFEERSKGVEKNLLSLGFEFKEKRQQENLKGTKYESTFNQIWDKK